MLAIVAPVTASEEPQRNLVTGGIFLISARMSMLWIECGRDTGKSKSVPVVALAVHGDAC